MQGKHSHRPEVLIVAAKETYLSRPLPSLFRKAGALVRLAAPGNCSLRWSRHVDFFQVYDPNSRGAVEALDGIVAHRPPQHLVVADEPLVLAILAALPETTGSLRRLLSVVPEIRSRAGFHDWAAGQGIPMPRGRVCRTAKEVEAFLLEHGPVFLKRDGSLGGSGVRRIDRPGEIPEVWEEVGDARGVLVQEALRGIVGVTEMIADHGQLLAYSASEKSVLQKRFGPSIARRMCEVSGMEPLARKLAGTTGFHGLCGFDWAIDSRDGSPKMLEFHPRPTSGFGLGPAAGLAYEKAMQALIGKPAPDFQRPDPRVFERKPVCCYFPDHPWMSLSRGDWAELRCWLPGSGARCWSLLPWDDPGLLLKMFSRIPLRAAEAVMPPWSGRVG